MVAAVVYTGAGGMLPLTVTSLVELPSPVQMVWSYARDGRRRFPALGGIYAAISPWFTLLYVLARVVRVLCRARASVARARASVARASACAEEAAPDSARIQCASWDHADAPVRPRTRLRSLARSCSLACAPVPRPPPACTSSILARSHAHVAAGGGWYFSHLRHFLPVERSGGSLRQPDRPAGRGRQGAPHIPLLRGIPGIEHVGAHAGGGLLQIQGEAGGSQKRHEQGRLSALRACALVP